MKVQEIATSPRRGSPPHDSNAFIAGNLHGSIVFLPSLILESGPRFLPIPSASTLFPSFFGNCDNVVAYNVLYSLPLT